MKVLLIRPGETPEVGELNCYEEIRDYIGGCIETVSAYGYTIVCNDEFLLNDSRYNITIDGIQFFGNIFICKTGIVDGEYDLVGLDQSDFSRFKFVVHFMMCRSYLIE